MSENQREYQANLNRVEALVRALQVEKIAGQLTLDEDCIFPEAQINMAFHCLSELARHWGVTVTWKK